MLLCTNPLATGGATNIPGIMMCLLPPSPPSAASPAPAPRITRRERSGDRPLGGGMVPVGGGERLRRRGASAGGGKERGPGRAEEPLDRLTVGSVAEFASQLEDPGGTERRHPDPPPPAVHLRVTVLQRR
ncbi:hypothetical protein LOK49_LG10G01666 [Camellia lanceoleosa]|uniref:Uncharacterized protein n=1 Tax=Camellia lanceoleosa TaxID=1840588 RepID=A0ACC0GHR3_9ERIC|nr:hypothetical protein LOK49_LG10G01666 [Camellia lanceoleosa]